ncbi:hypothetical protein AB0K02_04095 [Streptomyces sp. NPDC049597]
MKRYTVDATVTETGPLRPGPVVMPAPDADVTARLCDGRLHLTGV